MGTVQLCSGIVGELRGAAYIRESLKLRLRAAIHPRQTRDWIAFLNELPLFQQLLPSSPRLINKIYRDYFSVHLSCAERLEILASHYRLVIELGLEDLVLAASREPIILSHLQARAGDTYSIVLRATGVLSREGEFVLQLHDSTGSVFSIAFSFHSVRGALRLLVGCLQGCAGSHGRERVRTATRSLYGIRPAFLLTGLLFDLGNTLGCQDFVFVSNRNRVVTRSMREGRVFSDYDAIWRELGASVNQDGNFAMLLSQRSSPRPIEEVSSSKRAEYKRRLAMLDLARSSLEAIFMSNVSRY